MHKNKGNHNFFIFYPGNQIVAVFFRFKGEIKWLPFTLDLVRTGLIQMLLEKRWSRQASG